MDRRTFLKRAGLGGGVLLLGGAVWRVAGVWWAQPAAQGYSVLSAGEVRISDAIAEALFPGDALGSWPVPGGVEVGLTRYLDTLLHEMLDETTANAIRLLLHAIDEGAMMAGIGGASRLHQRPLEERVAILEAWDQSRISARRSAFSALKLFYAMGYCEHPAVLDAMSIAYTCTGQDEALGA